MWHFKQWGTVTTCNTPQLVKTICRLLSVSCDLFTSCQMGACVCLPAPIIKIGTREQAVSLFFLATAKSPDTDLICWKTSRAKARTDALEGNLLVHNQVHSRTGASGGKDGGDSAVTRETVQSKAFEETRQNNSQTCKSVTCTTTAWDNRFTPNYHYSLFITRLICGQRQQNVSTETSLFLQISAVMAWR